MAAELLTITLAANQRRTFERGGRYLEIIEGDSPIDLFLYGPQGEQQDEARAIVSGLFLEQRDPFARFDVQNGATAQTLRLLVTDGRAGSRRAPGIVTVTDAGRLRSLASLAYWSGTENNVNSGAFFLSAVSLANPAGSGRRLVVQKVLTRSTDATAAGTFEMALQLINSPTRTGDGLVSAAVGAKFYGPSGPGAAPVAQLRITTSAGGFTQNVLLGRVYNRGQQYSADWVFADPVIVLPGASLSTVEQNIALGGGAQHFHQAQFEWYEEPV